PDQSFLRPGFLVAHWLYPSSNECLRKPNTTPGVASRLFGSLFESLAEPVLGIDAKNFQRFWLRDEFKLLQRQFEAALLWMTLDISIKLRGGKAAVDHIAFQLGHIDAVGGETAERLVQRRRNVAYLKYESGDDALFLAPCPFRLARPHDKGVFVLLGVGDILFEDAQPIDFRRQLGRQGGTRDIACFGHFARGAGSIGGD